MLFFVLRRIRITIRLVINYLSKIIYHNITPSADYDATIGDPIARTFSVHVTHGTFRKEKEAIQKSSF